MKVFIGVLATLALASAGRHGGHHWKQGGDSFGSGHAHAGPAHGGHSAVGGGSRHGHSGAQSRGWQSAPAGISSHSGSGFGSHSGQSTFAAPAVSHVSYTSGATNALNAHGSRDTGHGGAWQSQPSKSGWSKGAAGWQVSGKNDWQSGSKRHGGAAPNAAGWPADAGKNNAWANKAADAWNSNAGRNAWTTGQDASSNGWQAASTGWQAASTGHDSDSANAWGAPANYDYTINHGSSARKTNGGSAWATQETADNKGWW